MAKKLFFIIVFISFFAFIWVGFVFALTEEGLEVGYPVVQGEEITKETGVPQLIKYIFHISLLIAGIAAFLALIAAGFKYLTSSGKPEAMADARKGIFAAFLGLVILLGSYLLLNTLNPELLVLRLKKVPLNLGVVLINDLHNSKNGTNIPDPISDPEGFLNFPHLSKKDYRIITRSNADVTDLGEVKQIVILPNLVGKIKLTLFGDKNFTGYATSTYLSVKDDPSAGEESMQRLGFNCNAPVSKGTNCGADKSHTLKSIAIRNITPGVYLYGDNPYKDYHYFTGSVSDFRQIDFNNKAKQIEIRNEWQNPNPADANYYETQNDFLAILHEDVDYQGKCRIFFTKRAPSTGSIMPTTIPYYSYYSSADSSLGGNTPISIRHYPNIISTEQQDIYGYVEKPSSIHIFRLDFPVGFQFPSYDTARALAVMSTTYSPETLTSLATTDSTFKLCTGPDFCRGVEPRSDCKCYTFNCNILEPQSFNVDLTSSEHNDLIDIYGKEIGDLEDNVRSIYIDGKCAVVLFGNRVTDKDGKIEGNWPGECQVFTDSNPDLRKEPIGKCKIKVSPWTWQWGKTPCASAVAAYPIK